MVKLDEIISSLESELKEIYDKEKKKLLNNLHLDRKKKDSIYICRDNERAYLTKPRSCRNYEKVNVQEYIEKKLSEITKSKTIKINGWRWLAECCKDLLEKTAIGFYITSGILYFDGGYIYVTGFKETSIIVSISKKTKETVELLKRLTNSPYRVEVFIGNELKTYNPREALEKLLVTEAESTG